MRVDGPLADDAAAWLDAHLAACDACRAEAEGYAADHALLRSLATPPPPRDLWANTAARLDREAGAPTAGRSVRVGRIPAGALAGVLVVAVVVGASYLTNRASGPVPAPAASAPSVANASESSSLTAAATPIAIDRQVGLVHAQGNGSLGVLTATVDEVCAAGSANECQADTNGSTSIAVTEHPQSVVQSPNGKQLAFVLSEAHGGSVVIVPAPSTDTSTPSAPPASASTSAPPASLGPTTPPPSATTVISPSPSSRPSPSAAPSVQPSSTGSPSVAPPSVPSPTPTTASPSIPSASPSTTPPVVLPSPSLAAAPISIAADVTVIGQSAAYSPSGSWFAFSARPADGSHGPDVYVWHTGDAKAHPVTSDHRSVFSTWVGENVLGSRAEPLTTSSAVSLDAAFAAPASASGVAAAAGVEARSVSFLLDPATNASRVVPGDGIWRPVVDPSGRFAVYWSGTIEVDAAGVDWSPANGTLVLARWDPSQLVTPVASPSPGASASAAPTPSASPGAPVALLAPRPVADWDARWDDTGTYLALWLADRAGDSSGRLTLHTVDFASGALDAAGAVVNDQVAESGFAIGHGRLAWVAPDGLSGPVVKVYAWAGTKGGTAQTPVQPGDTLVIR